MSKKISLHKLLKWLGIAVLTLIVILVLIVVIGRTITYFSNHINTENGVDEGVYVTLGCQEQYLLIRGEDVENPVRNFFTLFRCR